MNQVPVRSNGGLGPLLVQVLRRERAVEAVVLVRELIDPVLREPRPAVRRHTRARARPGRLSQRPSPRRTPTPSLQPAVRVRSCCFSFQSLLSLAIIEAVDELEHRRRQRLIATAHREGFREVRVSRQMQAAHRLAFLRALLDQLDRVGLEIRRIQLRVRHEQGRRSLQQPRERGACSVLRNIIPVIVFPDRDLVPQVVEPRRQDRPGDLRLAPRTHLGVSGGVRIGCHGRLRLGFLATVARLFIALRGLLCRGCRSRRFSRQHGNSRRLVRQIVGDVGRPRGVAPQEDLVGIPAVLRDMVLQPGNDQRQILDPRRPLVLRGQTVVDRNADQSMIDRPQTDVVIERRARRGLRSAVEAAAMYENKDRSRSVSGAPAGPCGRSARHCGRCAAVRRAASAGTALARAPPSGCAPADAGPWPGAAKTSRTLRSCGP